MSKEGKNGVTTKTPKNILFGAGTIHKNLKYTESAWNFADSIVGATSGGSTLSIVPEITTIEVDGALVTVKELQKKTGETATMEINFIELSKDLLKAALIAQDGSSEDTNYDLLESKPDIVAGDYWENVAFVGKTLDGRNIIVIMDNALCTSGLELSGANKDTAKPALTFTCHADLESDMDTLPYHIYYPKDAAAMTAKTSKTSAQG